MSSGIGGTQQGLASINIHGETNASPACSHSPSNAATTRHNRIDTTLRGRKSVGFYLPYLPQVIRKGILPCFPREPGRYEKVALAGRAGRGT